MTFHDILIDVVLKAETNQNVTVHDVVEELKEKLSGMMEGSVHEKS